MELDVMKFTLSANEIRQFGECARKRYYSSRDCLAIRANKSTTSLSLGNIFHKALDYYYTGLQKILDEAHIENPNHEEVWEYLEGMEPFDLNSACDSAGEAIQLNDRQTLAAMLKLYQERIVDDVVAYRVVACEQKFSMLNWPVKGVMYHGYIDMIVEERETGMIWFFEHKTCANFRPEIYNRFDIQLHIYDIYGKQKYGERFGGMLLNQVKKAKTDRGFGTMVNKYIYDEQERADFVNWIRLKTKQLASIENQHYPCNNYMTCKMCEYASICMKFGYSIPKDTKEVTENDFFKDEAGNPIFRHDPRDSDEEE